MLDVNVSNVITIALISLVALAAARWLKTATGLPLPV